MALGLQLGIYERLCRDLRTHLGGEQRIWCIYSHFSSLQPGFCFSYTHFTLERRRVTQCLLAHASSLMGKIFLSDTENLLEVHLLLSETGLGGCYSVLGVGSKLKILFFNVRTGPAFKNRSTVTSNSRKTPVVNCRGWTALGQQDHLHSLLWNKPTAQNKIIYGGRIYPHQLVLVFPKMTTLQKH